MVGETIDVLGQAVGIQLFDRHHNPSVEGPPTVPENTRVGDLVAQGVLEHIFQLWDESRLIQKFAPLKPDEASAKWFLRQVRHRPE